MIWGIVLEYYTVPYLTIFQIYQSLILSTQTFEMEASLAPTGRVQKGTPSKKKKFS